MPEECYEKMFATDVCMSLLEFCNTFGTGADVSKCKHTIGLIQTTAI